MTDRPTSGIRTARGHEMGMLCSLSRPTSIPKGVIVSEVIMEELCLDSLRRRSLIRYEVFLADELLNQSCRYRLKKPTVSDGYLIVV